MSDNLTMKFCKKIAAFECGCAPSVGFMEKLILEARKAINPHNDDIELEINKNREWGEPDENGVVEHIKSKSKGGQK